MGESAGHETIGQLFLTLYEMGFEESQVQAALRAGCFMVQDAADWILQKGPRGTLHTRRGTETGPGAVAAFNPPLDRGIICDSPTSAPDTSPDPELHLPSNTGYSQHRRDYDERQTATLAREVREEKRSKKKDRELVLQRIAEDRQKLQEKAQSIPPQKDPLVSQSTVGAAPDTGCALMVRLPSGSSVRLQFAADSLLQSVCDHLDSTQPSLAPCSLLQTFPTRHFSQQALSRSLRDLGLTPNATLCVRPKEKPCSRQEPEPAADSSPEPMDTMCTPDDLMAQGNQLLPIMSSPAYSVAPGVLMRDEPPPSQSHTWGRGQRLVLQEQDRAERDPVAAEGNDAVPLVSRSLGLASHQWPSTGMRLRPSDQSNQPGSPSAEPDPPNLRARMAAELRQESPEKVASASRAVRVAAISSLRHLALQSVIVLINAPSMQYSRSLSGMTPELAELIADHMIKERILRPRTLELFAGCPIRSLTLNCYPYCTNDLLRHLRGFTNMRTLRLSSCTLITDQGLSVVQYLHKLQYLNVSSCRKLTDSCLSYLTGLEHLSHLVLDQTKVSDDGLCSFLLQTHSSLTHLSVNQTTVTERTLILLSQRVPNLKLLSIKHTKVSDVSFLRELNQLNSLHLDNTQVTEQSLLTAASLSGLTTLTLSGVQSLTSDRVLQLLSGLALTRLVLPGRHCLTDDGLTNLRALCSLVELNLTDHIHITDAGVRHVSLLSRLQTLSLCNTSVSDAGLLHLRGLQHLEELSLDRTKVTSRGVSRCVPHLPHLQVLGLSDTAVGDNVLKHGIRHCRNLLKVNLSRTRITNKGLRFLKAVSAVQLNLDGTGVTLQGVSDLMASCVSIVSVRANNLRQIPNADLSDEE